jgi:hypothetical protein
MFCSQCGSKIEPASKFCASCGTKIESRNSNKQTKSYDIVIKENLASLKQLPESKEKRTIIQKTLFNIIDDIALDRTGKKFFSRRNDETAVFDYDSSKEFIINDIPKLITEIATSKLIPKDFIPITSTFLDFFANAISASEERVGGEIFNELTALGWHKLNLGMIEDDLDDMNIMQFYETNKADNHINFYLEAFPDGKEDFIKAIENKLARVSPGKVIAYGDELDRKDIWKTMVDYYRSKLFPKITTLRDVLQDNDWLKEYVEYFERTSPNKLDEAFVSVIQCSDGKLEVILFTDKSLCVVSQKSRDRNYGQPMFFEREQITDIKVGSEVHESYGFMVLTSIYWILTIHTANYHQYSKYVFMGRNESDLNESRPGIMRKLEAIGAYYPLSEGDPYSSESGIKVYPTIGFWRSF